MGHQVVISPRPGEVQSALPEAQLPARVLTEASQPSLSGFNGLTESINAAIRSQVDINVDVVINGYILHS